MAKDNLRSMTTGFKLRRGGTFYVGGYEVKIVRIRRGDVDVTVTQAGPTLLRKSDVDAARRCV